MFRPDLILPLLPSALTVAILAAVESLLSAVVADSMIGDRHNSNAELVAQGIANLATPLVGGIPVTGAIARTATNFRSGAKSPVSGMVHSLTLLAILLVLAARPSRIQRRLQPFLHHGAEAAEAVRRAAEIDGAGKRCVIAVVAAAELEIADRVRLVAVARPGEVRRGTLGAGRRRGQRGRMIAPEAGGAADLRRNDGGDHVALAHARRHCVHADLHGIGDDRRGGAHHGNLRRRLHDPRPGDEPAGVDKAGVGKPASELGVGSCGVVPAVELDPDASASVPSLRELGGEEGGRVTLGGIDIDFRIGNDAVRGQEGRYGSARRVYRPPDPKGLLAVVYDHDELVHVEGPAVITGKMVQARRIGGAERLDPGLGHRRLHAAEAGEIFALREGAHRRSDQKSSGKFARNVSIARICDRGSARPPIGALFQRFSASTQRSGMVLTVM